ncbi:hypothetical protein IV203_031067 [Nitzschia inconspicua]|uniref:Uncharacterized protein n=1 Tax=Nitzschia inconspicua TaxID=303405 RepID=A0A9K3Q4S6_9STRA|nr:hypothetical protein IV203_031067 [Nitzschia inconspicua]
MSSSTSPREVLQLSLGPKANAITAHLLNLHGLAATNGNEDINEQSHCDPVTTHYVQDSTWVPRVLMIDEAVATVPTEESTANKTSPSLSSSFLEVTSSSFIPWHGDIRVLGNGSDSRMQNQPTPFFQTASTLAYSQFSRYHAKASSSQSQRSNYQSSSENPRHVAWDDDDDQEDENEDAFRRRREAQDYAKQQQAQARNEWKTSTSITLGRKLQQEGTERFSNMASRSSSSSPFDWTDIWMPPYSNDSKVVLPFSSQSQLVPHWDVAYSMKQDLPFWQEWKEDVLFEKLRHLLEPCDSGIQGAIVTTEGCGLYATMTTMLLDELQDECKSAARWVNHVQTPEMGYATAKVKPEDLSWQERQVARVRGNISNGLALYDFTQKSHVVLPLRTDFSNAGDFQTTARIAMALEVCGLPFRLREQSNRKTPYQLGLQNAPFMGQGGSDTDWGNTASRLSMGEYLTMLQPSSQYSMIEMDVMLANDHTTSVDNRSFYETIRAGTSVERGQRMRERGEDWYRSRPADVLPGTWLKDVDNGNNKRGLLSSLSYKSHQDPKQNIDRSVHRHFTLSTAVRPLLVAPSRDNDGISMQNYLTCLVQGMGIQYRPERSMATIVDETIGRLTFGSNGGDGVYGAGMYWKDILPSVDAPVVAVLGNTTRAYWSLDDVATNMKSTVRGSKFHGYVSRDILNGVLPELDDCEEALEGCFDKRDLYHPPKWTEEDFLDFD